MKVSLSKVLEAVKAKIASFTGVNVTLGTPDDSKPGLFIFAYMLSEDSHIRNFPARNKEKKTDQSYFVHCLLMPSPVNDYVAIDKGLRCLRKLHILALGENKVEVTMSPINMETLDQVFRSAGVTLRLAIHFELKWTIST